MIIINYGSLKQMKNKKVEGDYARMLLTMEALR